MKKIYFLFLLCSIFSFSQVEEVSYKVIKLVEPQNIFINGGIKSTFGGSSRSYVAVNLPPNTIEWFYAFTTENLKTNENTISLQEQLINSISKVPNPASIAVSLLSIPDGVTPIDVFLCNRKGYDDFFEKDFFNGWKNSNPAYFPNSSALSRKEGKTKVSGLNNGTFYLCIRNTSKNTGVNVKLEVVAIVKETIINKNIWNKDVKQKLYDSIFNLISKHDLNDTQKEDFSLLMVNKIVNLYSPEGFSQLAEFEIKNLFKKIMLECDKELGLNLILDK